MDRGAWFGTCGIFGYPGMKVVSWNVNGIRACAKKGFLEYLSTENPDILFLQETKAMVDDLPPELVNPMGYHCVFHSAEKKGYSGVALYTKVKPIAVHEGFGYEKYDREGRVIIAEYDHFYALGVYFPNGQKDDERLAYKLAFYKDLFEYCETLKQEGKGVLICGDYNTAHNPIDLARPKENEFTSGFLQIERDWMDKIVAMGYTDTFRHFNDSPEEYSWWSYRMGARARNVGWRIDYVFVDNQFLTKVSDAFIQQSVLGSDHCPVGVVLNL